MLKFTCSDFSNTFSKLLSFSKIAQILWKSSKFSHSCSAKHFEDYKIGYLPNTLKKKFYKN
ncbi:MAG: hypothetical protein EAZ27_11415 [Cytophagales bacterium]|nr:MAG: hypothetical protein EAZ27_11415 [Cytophagales bacterium]